MQNFPDFIRQNPGMIKQFSLHEILFLNLECPPTKTEDWAEHNCFIHIIHGKKHVYTRQESFYLQPGSTVFIKKGALTVETIGPDFFCGFLFYIPDNYLRSVVRELKVIATPLQRNLFARKQIIPVETTPMMQAFYESLHPYFTSARNPSPHLLELKFKELLLNIISNENNLELNAYLIELANSSNDELPDIMEKNCLYNLELYEYARLCHRSLSSFKRDFYKTFNMPPGRWLLNKRLENACMLLQQTQLAIKDVMLESGFNNMTHFDKVFKKHFYTSPLQYRREKFQSSLRPLYVQQF